MTTASSGPFLSPMFWDVTLVVAVSAMSVVVSYARSPRAKALMICIPIPFTIATLAVGKPVNITHLSGLFLLLMYVFEVYFLHRKLKVPIIIAIIFSALSYAIPASLLADHLPRSNYVFWATAVCVVGVMSFLSLKLPKKSEPGYRTPLPIHIKLPFIILTVVLLIVSKRQMEGFISVFPMVGLIAAYEARRCLWSICKQAPMAVLTILPLILTARVAQPLLGLELSLLVGWCIFFMELPFVLQWQKRHIQVDGDVKQEAPAHAAAD